MAKARFAQHFLIDQRAIKSLIAAIAPTPTDQILEIGPGRGALTQELIERQAHVWAVDIDQKMIDSLTSKFGSHEKLKLICADILKVNFEASPFSQHSTQKLKVVGNLPYTITSPILYRLAEWTGWDQAYLMVQKEVGDRLCATVGTSEYGALTVGMNLTCTMTSVLDLPPEAFRPKPKVHSKIVKCERRAEPLTPNIPQTQKVIQAAFQQRRKTILNSLSHGLGIEKEKIQVVLQRLSISENLRAQNLTSQQFVTLGSNLRFEELF